MVISTHVYFEEARINLFVGKLWSNTALTLQIFGFTIGLGQSRCMVVAAQTYSAFRHRLLSLCCSSGSMQEHLLGEEVVNHIIGREVVVEQEAAPATMSVMMLR